MSDCPCLKANVCITRMLAIFECFRHNASQWLLVSFYKSISIVARLCAGRSKFHSWQGQDVFFSFSLKCSGHLWSPPSHLLNWYWWEGQPVYKADHSPPCRAEVRNEWSYTSVSSWCAQGQLYFLPWWVLNKLFDYSWYLYMKCRNIHGRDSNQSWGLLKCRKKPFILMDVAVLIHIKAHCVNSCTHTHTYRHSFTHTACINVMATKLLYGHLTYHEDLYVCAIHLVQHTMGHILHKTDNDSVATHKLLVSQHMVCKCAHTEEHVK